MTARRRRSAILSSPAMSEPRNVVDLAPLWQSLRLRGVTLPNRVMCSATTLQYGEGGRPTARHRAFYRERALGGVGLLFTEQLSATPLSEAPFAAAIAAYDEGVVEPFRMVVEGLGDTPTRLFGQLVAGGGMGSSTVGVDRWGPVRAPSPVPAPGGETPLPLTEEEIAAVVADHVRSALHLREAGLHGVEVHGAHGWLVGEFLSPFMNRREDGYGGDVVGRCRLALEIGRALRAAVGDDYPVGLALTVDECIGPAGITLADTEAQLAVLAAAGIYDFFDLSIGASHSEWMTIASMAVPANHSFTAARAAMRVLDGRAAVFVAGRVVDVRDAATAVATGVADVVAMTRAHLADPHLVCKAREGRQDETTRCVGCNVCVGRALHGGEVVCAVNPVTGREEKWGAGTLVPAPDPRRVVVVGAGPAGLRVAATAAARGHDVVVLERAAAPGGHLRDLAWLPTRESWAKAVDDLIRSVERHGGRIVTGVDATGADVMVHLPDVVVIATGATWDERGTTSLRPDREAIPGAGPGRTWGLDRALAALRDDPRALGDNVVILDESGEWAPLGLAEVAAGAGARVRLVTPAAALGTHAAATLELPHVMPRLRRLGVETTVWHGVGAISGARVILDDVWGDTPTVLEEVSAVVLAVRRVPRDALHEELLGVGVTTVLVGDVRSPRSTTAVIHEAEGVARAL